MRKIILLFTAICLMGFIASINAQTRNPNQQKDEQKEKLLELSKQFNEKFTREKAEAERIAQEKGWIIQAELDDGTLMEIMRIDENGMPEYNITNNLNAAKTSETDHLWTGVWNLDGTGMLVGEWDGGGVLTTHQEFDGRVTQKDSPGSTHYHSTHVAGTIIAQGQVPAAHGMASNANLDAYDWNNDESEMANAAAVDDLILSNHSYSNINGWYQSGSWYWYGNVSISTVQDYKFGFYGDLAHNWDIIANNAPHYLICKSAGNDRDDDHTGGHYYWSGSNWVYSTAYREPDGGTDGYDCIGNRGVAKNLLTVGAVWDIPAGYSVPADVIIEDYSGWGPTDDGRIKPDIVANGRALYSTSNTSNSSYLTIGGTSMSTPTATGTLTLLQDYYNQLRGGFMSAAALKGLVINTAHEAGPADGPDYMFGWGLLNATGAADLITNDDTEGGLIVEGILLDNQNIYYTYYCDGSTEVNVTLIWNDPAHAALSPSLNPTTLALVNDLDVYIYDAASTYYYPWRLNPTSPSLPATNTSFNYRDNVEKIDIPSPAAGYYTILVDEFSTLPGGQQAYALIITGLSTPPTDTYCSGNPPRATNEWEYIQNVTMGDIDNTSNLGAGGYMNYTGLVNEVTKGGSETITVTLENAYSGDDVYAWVDWNQDGDFYDTGEEYFVGTGTGPHTTSISVPSSATSGYTTMRVRMVWSTPLPPPPCGTLSDFGETEDYALYVVGTPGLWTGLVSTNWNVAGNWDDLTIPTSTVNVTIPSGTPHQPTIGTGTTTEYAYCDNLTIQSGAVLTQTGTTTYRSFFHVNGNFNSDAGTFTQNSDYAFLYLEGSDINSSWDDDNEDDTYTMVRIVKTGTNTLNMWQNMTVKNLEVREGNFRIDASWTLTVTSALSYAFQVEAGGILTLTAGKTIDVTTGDVEFANGSQANVSGGLIRCGDEFRVLANAAYDIQFTGGTVEMYGSLSQYIEDHDGNTELYDLIINKSAGTCYLNYGDLVVNNELTINSGAFTLNGYEATVAHDCHVYGTLNMTNAADVLNVGISNLDNLEFYNGSTGNLSNGEVYLASWIRALGNSAVTAANTNTLFFTGSNSSSGLRIDNAASYVGNVNVNKSSGNFYLWADNADPIIVNGNFTIQAGNTMDMQYSTMVNHGIFTDNATSTIYVYNGPVDSGSGEIATGSKEGGSTKGSGSKGAYLEIDNDFTLNGLLDVADGDVLLHGDFHMASTGTLNITTGTVIADQSYKGGKAWQYLNGTISLTNGLFEISHNSMRFSSTSVNNISGGIMRCGFTFYAPDAGIFQPLGGTVEMTGNDPAPYILCSYANGNYFNELLIDRSNYVALHSDIEIKNNLLINSGPLRTFDFSSNQYDIYVGGNWTNNGGDAAFEEGTGRVVFNGPGPGMQWIYSDETFNILENNTVQAIRIGNTVTCNSYDWTSGSISVSAGTFIANDLVDSGIYGNYYALTNSEIYLHQDAGQFVDLFGDILIYGSGVIKVYGGADESYWCSGTPLDIDINSGGVLDFVDWGITIWATQLLTYDLVDGTIRTGGHFTCYRTDFNPTGSTFEFYGGTDANINVAAGSTLFDVLINKSGGDKSVVQYEDRDGTTIESTKSNSASLYSNIDIINDLTISDGSLVINNYTATIDGDCNINAMMDVGTTGNVLNHGLFELGSTGTLTITGGSFVNDHPYGTDAWQNMYGALNLSAGLFEIMYNSIDLESTFVDNITGGTMRTGCAFRALTAGTFEPSGGNVEFTGNSGMSGPYIYCDAGNYFNDFDMNSSVYYVLNTNIEVRGDVTIDNGLLKFNSLSNDYDLSCFGNVNINNGGSMSIGENSTLKLDDGSTLNVYSGGEIQVIGTAGNEATITHISTGTYHFWVYGTIGAEYAIFEYMDLNGINVRPSGIVDPAYTFNNCAFQKGAPAPSALLVLHQDQTFTCNNAYFENTFGNTEYNVWKYENNGDFTFYNASGDFAGEDYDYDPYNRVDWVNDAYTVYGNVTYANAASTALSNVTVNLMDGAVIVASDISDINGDFNFPDIAPGTYHFESTTLKAWGGLSMNDVQLARQYVTGQPPGNALSGLHLEAGDVDTDGFVLMNDVQAMRQEFTSQPPGFTHFWIFEEPVVTVIGGMGTQYFQGICAGDTDGSYVPPVTK